MNGRRRRSIGHDEGRLLETGVMKARVSFHSVKQLFLVKRTHSVVRSDLTFRKPHRPLTLRNPKREPARRAQMPEPILDSLTRTLDAESVGFWGVEGGSRRVDGQGREGGRVRRRLGEVANLKRNANQSDITVRCLGLDCGDAQR